jgi:hypothetical protein
VSREELRLAFRGFTKAVFCQDLLVIVYHISSRSQRTEYAVPSVIPLSNHVSY